MAGKMTVDRAKLILTFVIQNRDMRADGRAACTAATWVALKLSCTERAADRQISRAVEVLGPARWNQALAAKGYGDLTTAGPAVTVTAGTTAVVYDATAEADKVIRDFLNGQVTQHQRQLKDALIYRPVNRNQVKVNDQVKAYSAAMIKLAGSLLDHLDAEAKQARADDAEDQAEIERMER